LQVYNNSIIQYIFLLYRPIPQKETSHWWQMKFKSNENSVSNQVAVPVPVPAPIHQKVIIKPNIIYIIIFS